MTEQSPRDIDWPTRRWLLWGFLAVLVVTAIALFFVFIGNADDDQDEDAAPGDVEQMEWSITLADFTGDEVTLKGDLPLGVPTETWQNDFQVARTATGSFEWDLDQELPATVVEIDEAADCEALNAILADLVSGADQALEPGLWQARAFGQHALDKMRDQGCTVDDAALQGL
jgi:hypothetical protein